MSGSTALLQRQTGGAILSVSLLVCLLVTVGAVACDKSYRVGDRVRVKWCDAQFPGYVVEKKSAARYRIHFEGYEARWDTNVSLDDIVARIDDDTTPGPPLCPKVARALGINVGKDEKEGRAAHKVGARVKVSWRGSVYKATIVKVKGVDSFLVHYDGHQEAWDEVVTSERILGKAN